MPQQEYSKITDKEVLGLIFQALEQDDGASWTSQIGMMATSTNQQEKYAWLGQTPMFREWKGPRVVKKLLEYDYTLRNLPYEVTIGFKDADLRREKVAQIRSRISDLASRQQAHWAQLISTLITTNGTCYDGQAFFSASHSEGSSGTQTNLLTSTEVTALNIGTAGQPTAAEAAAIVNGVTGKFFGFKDDQGEYLNTDATSFIIMVPTPELLAPMQTAVAANTITTSGGASVDNPVKGTGWNFQVKYNPRLAASSSAVFYVFRTDASVKPFIRQQEGPVNQTVLGPGSDHYFFEKETLYGMDTSRAAGYGMWQYALHCTTV